MSSPKHLLGLPTEIIQQIAGHTTAYAAVRLGETCKTLQTICRHAVVFQNILLSRAPEWPEVIAVVKSIERQVGLLDYRTWVLYAMMCDKADRLVELVEMSAWKWIQFAPFIILAKRKYTTIRAKSLPCSWPLNPRTEYRLDTNYLCGKQVLSTGAWQTSASREECTSRKTNMKP